MSEITSKTVKVLNNNLMKKFTKISGYLRFNPIDFRLLIGVLAIVESILGKYFT